MISILNSDLNRSAAGINRASILTDNKGDRHFEVINTSDSRMLSSTSTPCIGALHECRYVPIEQTMIE